MGTIEAYGLVAVVFLGVIFCSYYFAEFLCGAFDDS